MRMSLRDEVAVRRGTKFCCVESLDHPVVMVRICPWQAKEWVLPWSRFEASSFVHEEESERIEFFFSHYQVIAVGKNLRGMLEDICLCHIRCLRDLPETLYPTFDPTEPFIAQLEVRPLADPKNRPPVGVPF